MVIPGNGVKEGDEECDDGNTIDNDGCSSVMKIELNYKCQLTTPSKCYKVGNGVKDPTE